MNTLPDTTPTGAAGYAITPCTLPGHTTYWLAGVTRLQPAPPPQAGIWRCVVCCPPLPIVKETKGLEELIPEREST